MVPSALRSIRLSFCYTRIYFRMRLFTLLVSLFAVKAIAFDNSRYDNVSFLSFNRCTYISLTRSLCI